MRHSIGYDDWLAYLDGALESSAAARIRGHIERCEQCRVTWQELLLATAALREAARAYAAVEGLEGETVRRGRQRVLARIRASVSTATLDAAALEDVAGGELTIARLRRLQCIVAPACGAQTAFRLIVASVARTPVRRGTAAWENFLTQLAELTSAVCGRSMARLVMHIGSSLN